MNNTDADAIAAGYTAFGQLLADNPHLTTGHEVGPARGSLNIYLFLGGNIRARILEFVEAFRAAGWEISEYTNRGQGGIKAQLGALTVKVYADTADLGAEPPPPPPAYVPLLVDEDQRLFEQQMEELDRGRERLRELDEPPVDDGATQRQRCLAAHPDDQTDCDGPVDAVQVVDKESTVVTGCIRHGAVLLASLDGGRIWPGSVDGAAIEVHKQAQHLRPFSFGGAA
ncbi:hypothetical protein Val02_81750 [Virgisporangium aliadipatigenens]|uniref:Uncharacterized protein n=1 Tax=Virgisporangium aliadipatigenens TaxID=741659 RepID=A0A8J3YSZ2_9ACTN|nr:hypothetical protein [Virgisporangium aliadipatigenens]GIJ51289.1 hypothetical protein Val02_81750 [Virgisporangium aliadipatigenens]